MKNLFLIIVMLLSFSCKAQEYPLNTDPGEIPSNAYLKDMNNELDKYVGVWKGSWDGKTLYIQLKKLKHYSSIPGDTHPYYVDVIFGERKVVAADGTIEIDRITNFDEQGPEIRGIFSSLRNGNWKRLYFSPKNMCGKRAALDITSFAGNQMTLHFEYMPSIYKEDCIHNAYVEQHGDFPINFPKDIVLTKQ
ncbi:hypothetical protein PYS58_01965 [Chryseobacterium indologenes]|uniref:DUF6705 family protein n=1 Tax=Chryseobacterium indologenes TaxID=253 RepID=UPI0023E80DCC|nr:DUF6705 family protein [Chryseobacterium indologenes]WET49900.1 hypothetical protein PYS58_01965 [Chryseobacterium indologenes]